jgi:hypothetical protein
VQLVADCLPLDFHPAKKFHLVAGQLPANHRDLNYM